MIDWVRLHLGKLLHGRFSAVKAGFVLDLNDVLLAERERWPLWIPVLLGIGIALYFGQMTEPPLWIGMAILAGAAISAVVLKSVPRGVFVSLCAAIVAAGFTTAQIRTLLVSAPILKTSIRSAEVSGRVVTIDTRERGMRVVLDDVRILVRDLDPVPDRVRLTLNGSTEEVRPGDCISVRAALRPPLRPVAPDAFDFGRKAFFIGLGAVGYATGSVRIIFRAPGAITDGISQWVSRLRVSMTRFTREAVPGVRGAVATALLTGDRGGIPEHVLADMRNSGLAHLLAISGLHVGLLTGLLFIFVRGLLALVPPVAVRYPIKKWAAAISLVGAFGYLLVTGATIPTQRAFLMITLALLAIVCDRLALSMTVVAWVAIVILLGAPESLPSASFQMSFGAVVALIAVYEALGDRLSSMRSRATTWRRVKMYLLGVILTTAVAGFATAPFAIFHFSRVAAYGLAGNLIAVPIMAFWIMPWALAAYILFPLGQACLALKAMSLGIGIVLDVAHSVAVWPGAVRLSSQPLPLARSVSSRWVDFGCAFGRPACGFGDWC